MGDLVLYMSMSLDGFVAGPHEGPGNGLGDGGSRLHEWLLGDSSGGMPEIPPYPEHLNAADREVMDEFFATGAVLAGPGTVEPAELWGGDHHDGVPIVVLARHGRPPSVADMPGVRWVDDVGEAARLAREGAGEKDVLVHGAGIAQALLGAGLLDVIQLHLVPVLLGEGRRLFDDLGVDHVELERVSVRTGTEATHLRYRVRR
jgi:dihydrofolate reductase